MENPLRLLLPLALLLAASPAAASVWAVSPNGDDAATGDRSAPLLTLGAAFARAAAGDEIDVAAGTYAETLTATALDGITLLGGWSADFASRDPIANATAVVGDGVGFPLRLVDCKEWRIDGFAFDGRGAWYAVTAEATLDVATFTLALSNCTVTGASAYGVYLRGARATIDRCAVTDNGQAGIAAHSNYEWVQLKLTRSLVARNGSGLYLIGFRLFEIFNNVIADNAGWGVWISYPGWTAQVFNNTIVRNAGGGIGAGYYKAIWAQNNIIAFNGAPGFNNVQNNYVQAGFNDVYGNVGGDYFNVVPPATDLSVDPGLDDTWHLAPGSPLVDAGTDLSSYLGDDLDGEGRTLALDGDGLFDIGADELQQYLAVSIDVLPGTDPNVIELSAGGTVPVAVLGSATFDASTIDVATIRFAGAPVATKNSGEYRFSLEDSNLDGILDAVVHVRTRALALTPGDAQAVLEGVTVDGYPFRGRDAVVALP